jgi:geranylgeranyl diphosphate synthase type I
VIGGQHLDLLVASNPASTERDARRVAVLKSARYTVTRPLLLGAALAEPAEAGRIEPALTAYGDAIGLAFQMRDDVLGVFGDPAATGKSRLDDLQEGKRTVLVLRALRLADGAGRRVLERSLGNRTLDEDEAGRCREIIEASGALASVEALIAAEHDRAMTSIQTLPPIARAALEHLALAAIERDG